jgi:hypothetical protein
MPKSRRIKVIIDTNLFISFLIGKKLQGLKKKVVDFRFELIFAEQSIQELMMVSQRQKFNKFFKAEDLDNLVDLIKTIGRIFKITHVPAICRDPKDDYLLDLARKSKADYLVTGDIDLLEIESYKGTRIITVKEFDQIMG